MEKVKLTVHVTAEAAGILFAYAGDRNRGEFLSQLLIAQRARDELARVAAEEVATTAAEASRKAAEAAKAARDRLSIPDPRAAARKRRHGGRK